MAKRSQICFYICIRLCLKFMQTVKNFFCCLLSNTRNALFNATL